MEGVGDSLQVTGCFCYLITHFGFSFLTTYRAVASPLPARCGELRCNGLGAVARDQRSLGACVMLFQSEVTTARPELDRERARLLFVGVEMEVSLPLARRDQAIRDIAQRHCRAQRTVGGAVLERARHALLRHRSRALYRDMVDRFMCLEPCADAERVDALLRFDADDGDVDRVDQLRCRAVDNVDDSKATVNAGIDAGDLHAQRSQLMRSRVVGPSL